MYTEIIDEVTDYISTAEQSLLEYAQIVGHLQYKILNEAADEKEKKENLSEFQKNAISNFWDKLIALIKNIITKIKDACSQLVLSISTKFDVYGKWVEKHQTEIIDGMNKAIKEDKTIRVVKWATDDAAIENIGNFSNLRNIANSIISDVGRSEGEAAMRESLRKYNKYKLNIDMDTAIYCAVVVNALRINPATIEFKNFTTKNSFLDYLKYRALGGDPKNSNPDQKLVDTIPVNKKIILGYIQNIKDISVNIRSVKKVISRGIIDNDFDRLLDEVKTKRDRYKNSKNNDIIKYSYYRERFNVLSEVQKAAFDISKLKLSLFNEYIRTVMPVLKYLIKLGKADTDDNDSEESEV